MKLELSRQVFEQYSNIKINQNSSFGGTDLFHAYRQTDRQTHMTDRQTDIT